MEKIRAAIKKAKEQRESLGVAFAPGRSDAQLSKTIAWAELPALTLDAARLQRSRIVTLRQSDPASVPFDMMRTRLLRTLKNKGWSTIGVTSPTPKCGKSMVSMNLAISIARLQECTVVLADLDLHHSGLAQIVGGHSTSSFYQYLRGDAQLEATFRCYGGNLAVAVNSGKAMHSSELLQSQAALAAVNNIKRVLEPSVLIFDLPPLLLADDVLAFAPNLDGVLIVAAANMSTPSEIETSVRQLAEQTNVLGVVLNKCEDMGGETGNAYY